MGVGEDASLCRERLEWGRALRDKGDSRERRKRKKKKETATLQLSFVLGEAQGAGTAPLGSSFAFPTCSSFPGRWQSRGLTSIAYPGSLLCNNLIHQRGETAGHGWEGSCGCPKAPRFRVQTGCRSPGFPGEECPAITYCCPGGCAWDLPLLRQHRQNGMFVVPNWANWEPPLLPAHLRCARSSSCPSGSPSSLPEALTASIPHPACSPGAQLPFKRLDASAHTSRGHPVPVTQGCRAPQHSGRLFPPGAVGQSAGMGKGSDHETGDVSLREISPPPQLPQGETRKPHE